jgi:ubiquinone/menaquinone biosynthesis C-methylase UbiE
MLSFEERMIKQSRKPTGKFGAFHLRLLNIRHGKVTQWGLDHITINKKDTILDVGCGGGKTLTVLANKAIEGKIYGIDYSEYSVKTAKKINKKLIDAGRVEIIHAAVDTLPFPDNFFNLVTAVESYYFWPDLISNLREILRVLKPESPVVLINEMYCNEKFEKRNSTWAKMGNFTYHLPEEFQKFLGDAGYSSIQIEVLESKNWIFAKGIKPKSKNFQFYPN